MQLPDLTSLPETVKPELLRSLFTQVISASGPDAAKSEALFALSDKQWHCYEQLSPDIASSVSSWVEQAWDVHDAELTEKLLGIIGSLGLDKVMPLLHTAVEDNGVPEDIRKDIQEAIAEFGPRPIDPYKGMAVSKP